MRALNLHPHQILMFQLRNHLQGYSPLMTIRSGSSEFLTLQINKVLLRLARVGTSIDSKIWQRSTESLKGVFKGHGASSAALSNSQLHKRFLGFIQGAHTRE